MPTNAPRKPKGEGLSLDGKIGPVPVKVALFLAVALVVYLYLRHRAKLTPTSQGSESAPAGLDSGSPFQGQGDATGGGSSGGTGSGAGLGEQPDYSPPATTQPFNFYFNSVTPDAGGGNVSTPVAPTLASSATPVTSFPAAPTLEPALVNAATTFAQLAADPTEVPFNPGSYVAPGPNSVGTVGGPGPTVNLNSYNAPTAHPPVTPHPVSVSANPSGGSANKRQGVFSVH